MQIEFQVPLYNNYVLLCYGFCVQFVSTGLVEVFFLHCFYKTPNQPPS